MSAGSCARCLRPLDRAALLCEADTCTDCERYRIVLDARTRKQQALARVNGNARTAHRERIDRTIRRFAGAGIPFSANDVRPVLADIPGPIIGARFNAAARAGVIRHVGYVQSTKSNTHAHEIKLWRGAA